MEKSVVDLTVRMINLKKKMIKTEVKDIDRTFFDRTFFVKLRGLNIENNIFIHNYLRMNMIIILMNN